MSSKGFTRTRTKTSLQKAAFSEKPGTFVDPFSTITTEALGLLTTVPDSSATPGTPHEPTGTLVVGDGQEWSHETAFGAPTSGQLGTGITAHLVDNAASLVLPEPQGETAGAVNAMEDVGFQGTQPEDKNSQNSLPSGKEIVEEISNPTWAQKVSATGEQPAAVMGGSEEHEMNAGDRSATDDTDERPWTRVVYGKKRKQMPSPAEDAQAQRGFQDSPRRRTIILRPTSTVKIEDVPDRVIYAGLQRLLNVPPLATELRIRKQKMANTIAIDTWNPTYASKLLKSNCLPFGDTILTFQAYETVAENQIRGVIYDLGEDTDAKTLMEFLTCRTHRIVAARPMGRAGKAVLLTFEGTHLPRQVQYCLAPKWVVAFRPRAVVCINCHKIGHKADICPGGEHRCNLCGRTHPQDQECQNETPQCANCGGGHLAVDSGCPSRVKVNKEMRDRIKRQNERSRSRAVKNGTRTLENDSNTSQRIWEAKISSTQGRPDTSAEWTNPANVSDTENMVVKMRSLIGQNRNSSATAPLDPATPTITGISKSTKKKEKKKLRKQRALQTAPVRTGTHARNEDRVSKPEGFSANFEARIQKQFDALQAKLMQEQQVQLRTMEHRIQRMEEMLIQLMEHLTKHLPLTQHGPAAYQPAPRIGAVCNHGEAQPTNATHRGRI